MTRVKSDGHEPRLLPSSTLASLFEALTGYGYDIIGPTSGTGAIIPDCIQSPERG